MKINSSHLSDLALGSVFLATGGGGDPYIPELIARAAIDKYGPVHLLKPDELSDDAYIVTVGGVGAPTVSLELLPSLNEASNTLVAFEKHVNQSIDAVVSFEIGGGNSLIPIIAAAVKGVPVIDGDGMGRALPEAQMMTYAIAGVKPTPAIAYDYAGNVKAFDCNTTEEYEVVIRQHAIQSGGMITTAEHPMTGKQLKHAIIPETLSFSIRLGKLLREHRGPADSIAKYLSELFKDSLYGECRQLFSGKVIDKSTKIIGGYDIGEVGIEDFHHSNSKLKVSIKNEYLLAELDGEIIASVPDLIVIVDFETSQPINAERLRFGQRVSVFAVGCPDFFRTEKALRVVAPRCFGFDIDYVPLEELLKS